MKRAYLDIPLQIKEITEAGEFSGYGSVFGVKDSQHDIVMAGAFADSLAEHKDNGTMPAMLWQHDTREPIGVYSKVAEDKTGLFVEGQLLIEADELARRAHAHLKAGSITGLSIGYTFPDEKSFEWDKEKEAFLLHKINLWEVSLVTFPSNPDARIESVKAFAAAGEMPPPSMVERILRDAGLSRSQAKGLLARGYPESDEARDADLLDSVEQLKAAWRG